MIQKYNLPLEASTAPDGEAALDYIRQHPVDLLITDIRMPFLDGLLLSEKALEINPRMKIIISSGYQDFTYAKTAISLGVEEYLLKPIQPVEFTSLIQRIAQQLEEEKAGLQTDQLQRAYSRDQIMLQLLRGMLLPGKEGRLPQLIRSLWPEYGYLVLFAGAPGQVSSMYHLRIEISQLAYQVFSLPVRCIPMDSRLLLCIDGVDTDDAVSRSLSQKNSGELTVTLLSMINDMYHLSLHAVSAPLPEPERFAQVFREMSDSLNAHSDFSREEKSSAKDTESAHGKVRFICEYISSHYQENLGLETLAEIAYLNPDYLSRIFKRETGMNLNRYIKTYRLNQACLLLENTQQKITSISAAVGYQNCAYFVRSFTEHYGISPEKYRQQHLYSSQGGIL